MLCTHEVSSVLCTHELRSVSLKTSKFLVYFSGSCNSFTLERFIIVSVYTGSGRLILETLRLTFTANGKLQIFQGNFRTFSTAKLLIHASILMQSTVQIVLNSNS